MMFCTPTETRVARKQHQCTWCAGYIHSGDTYMTWRSVDDSWFTNKVHPECHAPLIDECRWSGGEYWPFDGERPAGRVSDPQCPAPETNINI